MLSFKKTIGRSHVFLLRLGIGLMGSVMLFWFCSSASAIPGLRGHVIWPGNAGQGKKPSKSQDTYRSPEGAVSALIDALSTNDDRKLSAIFGPEGKSLIISGDKVADRAERARFLQAYKEKNRIVMINNKKAILETGNGAWPFPIPIVKIDGRWRFSTREGREELLNRRIGRNELGAIEVCLAYVDAQREYASKDRNGDGVLEYAQRFLSEPGKKDGLYWKAGEGGEPSPLGPLIGEAQKNGYVKTSGNGPTPYYGYFYKILKSQGRNAPRGAYNYVIDGKMIGGFAMVAYPAVYGSSGIETFIVSQDGVVYQKDLGRNTASIAQAMKKFDPDRSWSMVQSKYLGD